MPISPDVYRSIVDVIVTFWDGKGVPVCGIVLVTREVVDDISLEFTRARTRTVY
jgi:hypothetical protein